jgi:hypothetical protein
MNIVLEWVEEAFKEPGALTFKSGKAQALELMDEGSNDQAEKENCEEKEAPNEKNNNGDDNPMSKLFYGKVSFQRIIFSNLTEPFTDKFL